MIFLVCSCGVALRTSGDSEEVGILIGPQSDWYPDKYPCPKADCASYMHFVENLASEDLPRLEVVDLTSAEAFAALHGLGLPEERDCGEAALRELHGKCIAGINALQIRGSNRSVIYHIDFTDGTRLFVGSGAEGAIAYRVAKARSFVREVSGGS